MIIAPPPKARISALDVVRGAAILGILMANIASFSGPFFALMLAPMFGIDVPGTNTLYEGLIIALVAGKFRGMLAILFGIGLMMQFQRRDAAGENWPGSYFKRTLILFGIGLLHGIFIWHGDILTVYAMTAALMMLFAKVSDKTLMWLIGGGLAYGGAMGGLSILSELLMGSSQADSSMTQLLDQAPLLRIWLTPEGETSVYAAGSYLRQMLHRTGVAVFSISNSLMLLPYFGALFAAGMLIARHRIWEDQDQLNRWLKRGMAIGFGVGLPLNLR